MNKNIPKLVKDDIWLEPFTDIILKRIEAIKPKPDGSFASGYPMLHIFI